MAFPTVRATDFPVSVTENPVTLTVTAETHTLPRVNEGAFRAFSIENSGDLTKAWYVAQEYIAYCQNQRRHTCAIFKRGAGGGFRGHSRG